MRRNNRSTNGETKTHAVGLGCNKRLENLIQFIWGNALATVGDRNAHGTVFGLVRA
jgi:hypothetical protein